ncbi:transglutaminase domain-containing protein [Streptomyces sp. S.PNR 29]|uniref:transglutaminase-like domain-containing protein n=1 Tax=Streptomyces sp. S.PNR 29 TaxID=2973805 RepID=UPI0025B1A801|nr:transglutaminase domain-containing protein [Streptomyces sp. S.PNR 29]MDN0197268.1 transglutaminase domain-containing protein [Streptomyces sp. S.PNR 29]
MDFLTQTPYSDPGGLDTSGLPHDVSELARTVRDLVIHRGEGRFFDYLVPEQRLHEDAESRYVTGMLRILRERGDGPLTRARPPEERFVGTCRDFSLLLCSLLRATGTPARLRCGFAAYFVDGFHEDHWVTEYRSPDGGWRLADAQVHHGYDIPFDPVDVPRDRFLVAQDAWRACREGRADPETFGLSGVEEFRGLWFVRGNVIRDLAALNGVELLPWDGWGPAFLGRAPLTEEDLAAADAAAAARSEDEWRRLSEDPRLAVPAEIVSYAPYLGARKVTLPLG